MKGPSGLADTAMSTSALVVPYSLLFSLKIAIKIVSIIPLASREVPSMKMELRSYRSHSHDISVSSSVQALVLSEVVYYY